MVEPVDLDALEKRLPYIDTDWMTTVLSAIAELRELRKRITFAESWAKKCEELSLEHVGKLEEMDAAWCKLEAKNLALEAWKERLGPPDGWFPSLGEGGSFPGDDSPWGELERQCEALLERAKETP